MVDSVLRASGSQLDQSKSHLLYVPVSVVKSSIPDYVPRFATMFNRNVETDLNGILYPLSQPLGIHPKVHEAWWVYSRLENPVVEPDSASSYYRVYPFDDSHHGAWTLVKSPPLKAPKHSTPTDWSIGYCANVGAGSDTYSCKVDFTYQDKIHYQYSLHQYNLRFRDQINERLLALFLEWESNCHVADAGAVTDG